MSLNEKFRSVVYGIQQYGVRMDDPAARTQVFTLPGAGRLTVEHASTYNYDYVLEAGDVEIRGSAWKGQFGSPEIDGSAEALDRILRNTETIGQIVESEKKAAAKARHAASAAQTPALVR